MRLTLIRHSKTSPTADIPIPLWGLSKEGIRLAKKLSKNKIIKEIGVIYSSLQTKALETALLLAKSNTIPIKTNPNLTEISLFTIKFFGSEKYEENVKNFYSGKIKRIAGGETYQEAIQRFSQTIDKIINEEKRGGIKNVGIVSHGNILAFFSAQFCSHSPFEIHQLIKMPDVAILDWQDKKFIKFYGETI